MFALPDQAHGKPLASQNLVGEAYILWSLEWDGRDKDGDRIANGVYLYKVIAKAASQTKEIIEKLAKIE